MKRFFGAIDLQDVVGLVGAALIVAGVYQVYQPAAFIVGGLMLVVPAVAAARK